MDRLTGISKQAEQLGNEGAQNTSTLAGLLRTLSSQLSQLGDEQAQSRYWLLGQTVTSTCEASNGGSGVDVLCNAGLTAAGVPDGQRYNFIQDAQRCWSADHRVVDPHCIGALVQRYRFQQTG